MSSSYAVGERCETTLKALRTDVKKGLASGKGKPAEEVLGRLERKYADMVRSRHKR